VFTVAVCLLVLDGLATASLCLRRRRLRRLRREHAVPRAVVTDETRRASKLNEDLARRRALLQVQRSTHPANDTWRSDAQEAVRRPVAGSGYEIRRAAELLAAMPELVYDAAVWETY
jgi:hypothetical protein